MRVVLAEKPSVGSSIAQVVGARSRRDGYFEGNGYQVTWAVGHLVEFAPPETMNPSWESWSLEQLPLVPAQWPLQPRKDAADQFKVVKKLLRAKATTEVICATDAAREGEHIFRLIYQLAECKAPVRRLWISSLTDDAIRKGFDNLRPGFEYDGLAAAAEGRDKADWMVGLTLTRLYTLIEQTKAPSAARGAASVMTVGRVQTPTLALVVARDLQRKQFARTPYRQVVARFGLAADEVQGLYHREVHNAETGEPELSAELPSPSTGKLLLPTDDADAIVNRVKAVGAGRVGTVTRKTQKTPSPLLYDLSALQQEANSLWGWQATQTLVVAQRLYEAKLLSYPRTGSRHLDRDTAASVPPIFRAVVGRFRALLHGDAGTADLPKRFVDDSKVSDHHALIPTGRAVPVGLASEDSALYELVVRRFLQMWAATCVEEQVRLTVTVRSGHLEDLFVVRATHVVERGWKALELRASNGASGDDESQAFPPEFREGAEVRLQAVEALNKSKSPPPAYTEASLLKAMETAGKRIEDPELAAAMRGLGLGTPATRASILESLVTRGYLERVDKSLRATPKGVQIIARAHPDVRTPEITGRWEQRLERIANRQETLDAFLADVAAYLHGVVSKEREQLGARTQSASRPSRAQRGNLSP